MATNEPEFDLSRTLVLEEIAMIVEEAKATGETLRVGYHAGMLTDTYLDSGLSVGRISGSAREIICSQVVAIESEKLWRGRLHGRRLPAIDRLQARLRDETRRGSVFTALCINGTKRLSDTKGRQGEEPYRPFAHSVGARPHRALARAKADQGRTVYSGRVEAAHE